MAPVLQRLGTFALGVLLRSLFLRKMALDVCDDFSHVLNVVFVVLVGVFAWILVQDLDNLAPTTSSQTK